MKSGTYSTLMRGAYLDEAGETHHFLYQTTESQAALLASAETTRHAIDLAFQARGCELLTFQLAIETTERLAVPELLGTAPLAVPGSVLPFPTATRQF